MLKAYVSIVFLLTLLQIKYFVQKSPGHKKTFFTFVVFAFCFHCSLIFKWFILCISKGVFA